MIYRLAEEKDLPRLVAMTEQAKKSFRERGIDQWQKGDPNEKGLALSIEKKMIHVLEENGLIIGMITLAPGPEESYRTIDGAWLNDEPYCAFHRVCVEESMKGRGIAGKLFSCSEELAKKQGYRNIRIDTHADNHSMQRALAKNGYQPCGSITLAQGAEKGAPRLAFQKILTA